MRALRSVPCAGWLCALVAVFNAAAWGLITPPFHVPDEPQHIAYAQYLAENGRPARQTPGNEFSTEESVAFQGSSFNLVVGNGRGRPPWTRAEMDPVRHRLAAGLPRDNGGGLTGATANPPLYYALEAVPYWAARSGSLFDQLVLMRLLSALFAGITVLACFGFIREVLPGIPSAWAAGSLAVAFQPVFGFIGGGVSNDNLLYATSATILFLVARAFRRGMTPKLGVALGAAITAGLLTKGTTVGLLPGVALALLIVVRRAKEPNRASTMRAVAAVVAVPALSVAIYVVISNALWDTSLYAGAGTTAVGAIGAGGAGAHPGGLLGYVWQFYLPRLPFMADQWPGTYPLYDVWLHGFIGRFGWLDYDFPAWVYPAAAVAMSLITGLAATVLWRFRRAARKRLSELASYALCAAGVLGVIAIAGYRYRLDTGYVFEQARYLLPLSPLYGLTIATAARVSPRHNAPAAMGVGIVVIAMGHSIFAQLLTLGRYYA